MKLATCSYSFFRDASRAFFYYFPLTVFTSIGKGSTHPISGNVLIKAALILVVSVGGCNPKASLSYSLA